MNGTSNQTILIIGAGVSGLAAARMLARAGHRALVVEARDRIGGRIFTLHDKRLPVPIELGAEFIHGRSPAMMRVLNDSGLALVDASDSHWLFQDGQLIDSGEMWQGVDEVMAGMKSSATDRTFLDYLTTFSDAEVSPLVRSQARGFVEGFHAADTARIGVQGLIKDTEAADEDDGDLSFRTLAGYAKLAEYLSADAIAHGATIQLNSIVREIHWRRQGVELVCGPPHERRSLAGRSALLTLPLGVLQAPSGSPGGVAFFPELPFEKSAAIDHLAMGRALRVVLLFRHRFWEKLAVPAPEGNRDLSELGFAHYPGLAFPTWRTQLPVRAPMLVGWVGGPGVDPLANLSPTELKEKALLSLATILTVAPDDIRAELIDFKFHDWQADAFSRGTYSYVTVNGLRSQMDLSRPIEQTLFFAGEATAIGHVGTVHGAIISGERAARELIKMAAG